MNSPLYVVFNMVVNFAILLIFIRFLLQFAEVDKKHPHAAPAYVMTAVVDIFDRIFPPAGKGRVSTAALVLLLLLMFGKIAGQAVILKEAITPFELFFVGSITAILQFLDALRWVIMISIFSSFVVMLSNSIHPIFEIVMRLADPLIEPFRRFSPNLGMIDLTPLIAMLAITLLSKTIDIIAKNIYLAM